MGPPKCLENIVILCFERRFSKQNSMIRLKSNILAPPNFWVGYATAFSVKTPQGWRSRIWSQFALQGNQFRVSDASSVQQICQQKLTSEMTKFPGVLFLWEVPKLRKAAKHWIIVAYTRSCLEMKVTPTFTCAFLVCLRFFSLNSSIGGVVPKHYFLYWFTEEYLNDWYTCLQNHLSLLPGPALSRCNRCSCIGPRAMVFG